MKLEKTTSIRFVYTRDDGTEAYVCPIFPVGASAMSMIFEIFEMMPKEAQKRVAYGLLSTEERGVLLAHLVKKSSHGFDPTLTDQILDKTSKNA